MVWYAIRYHNRCLELDHYYTIGYFVWGPLLCIPDSLTTYSVLCMAQQMWYISLSHPKINTTWGFSFLGSWLWQVSNSTKQPDPRWLASIRRPTPYPTRCYKRGLPPELLCLLAYFSNLTSITNQNSGVHVSSWIKDKPFLRGICKTSRRVPLIPEPTRD